MEKINVKLENATPDCMSFALALYESNKAMKTRYERKSKIEDKEINYSEVFIELLTDGGIIFFNIYNQSNGYKNGALLGQILNGSILVPELIYINKHLSDFVRVSKDLYPEYSQIGNYDELIIMVDKLTHNEQMLLFFAVRCYWVFDLFGEYNYTCRRAALEFPVII